MMSIGFTVKTFFYKVNSLCRSIRNKRYFLQVHNLMHRMFLKCFFVIFGYVVQDNSAHILVTGKYAA